LAWIGVDGASALPAKRQVEASVLLLGLVGACLIAFGPVPETATAGFLPTLLYLPVPFVIWGAVRFNGIGASGTILIVTVLAISRSLQGATIFNAGTPEENVLTLQVFLVALACPTLLLGATIEELERAKSGMQDLAGSLLRLQDDERRRVSKELHEHIGQDLAAAQLVVGRLDRLAGTQSQSIIDELQDTLRRSMNEIRAVSYLLHPPLLDEAGLALALKSYFGGLSRRSGVDVELALSPNLGRFPVDVELVLFRVIQEAITNVHRTGRNQQHAKDRNVDPGSCQRRPGENSVTGSNADRRT
jgi:signal transduction histidine kinase